MNQTTSAQEGTPLPPLRKDLQVYPSTARRDGAPCWTILDPLRNRYFQIGWTDYQLLAHWDCHTVETLIQTVAETTTYRPTPQDIEQLVKFLYVNNLALNSATGDSQAFVAQVQGTKQNWIMWLIHNYLFFKVPLVKPDRFLKATLPLVEPFFSRITGMFVLLSGVLGIFLISRQWETFLNTFLYFFNMEGLLYYGLTLIAVKVCHELGHAYTAAKYGCRVPTMGVAFLVMFPVLFSDTSDAWRLQSRKQRIHIGAAGMIVEVSIALIATLLWNFLPDGPLRSATFFLATTSWVMGVLINVNPCLRFDGYYILSDWLGVPNLQDRSFAFGRWQLRRLLFGLDGPAPEPVPPSLRRTLILYAWSTWIYRLVLFVGIALIVYHFFFKVLGILLFAVEILWFILLPIGRELKMWWRLRSAMVAQSRSWVTAACFLFLIGLVLFPWPSRLSIPAIMEASTHATLYTPTPGKIVKVSFQAGQVVSAGDPLMILEAPHLDKEVALTRQQISVLQYRARRQFSDSKELQSNQVISKTLESRISQLNGLMKQRENLVLRSPIAGKVTDRTESLHEGRWINEELPLAYVIDDQQQELKAMALETDIPYLEVGQTAWFYPDDPMRPKIPARIREIRAVDEEAFDLPYLASQYGGSIPVRESQPGTLTPETSVYRVLFDLEGKAPLWKQAVRGVILVESRPWTIVGRAWERISAVLVRESGF